MQKLIILTVKAFIYIFIATSILSLVGLVYSWYLNIELPYLNWLITIIISEIIGIIIMMVKKGVKYMPEVDVNADELDTIKFMKKFISRGSSVTIVSNRLSWLDEHILKIIETKSKSTKFEIIIPNLLANHAIQEKLQSAGVTFFITNEEPPESRFTLINADRSGSEKLAIARGVHPEHEITIFDNNSGPQIIAMAKDIIRKSKESANRKKNNAT